MSTEPPKPIIDLSSEFLSKLMEHCESARVFVTYHDGNTDETAIFTDGKGNFYAQKGQIDTWLEIQRQREREYAKQKEKE